MSNNKGMMVEPEEEKKNIEVNQEYYEKARSKMLNMTEKQKKDLQFSMSWFLLTDNIIKKQRLQIQRRMKWMDLFSLFLASLGVFTNILSSFYYIDFLKQEDESKLLI